MATDTSGAVWVFDIAASGEGLANATTYLKRGTFTSADTDITTMANHGFRTGDGPFRVTTSAADLPAGLATGTDYCAIYLSASTFSFASSLANAEAGTAVDITDAGTGTHTLVMLPTFKVPIYIRQFKLDTGDGGNFLMDESSGGQRVSKLDSTPANDTLWVPIDRYVEGIYITTLPANASVEVYHGVD